MSEAHDPMSLPADLPVPRDDGAADHLPGRRVPAIELPSTGGSQVRIDRAALPRLVVYAYPRTGRPGERPLVDEWDLIPGARGCTPEACGFRDHHSELREAGAEVYGLSTQPSGYQQEVVERLALPFALLSDAELRLARALDLPTFEVASETLLRRLTLVVRDGVVERVWYPVFPPDRHAEEVLAWLDAHPVGERGPGGSSRASGGELGR
jgi:peroxiredoxin